MDNNLSVTKDTVNKWIKAEKISCHRVHKLLKFKISEVDVCIINGGAGEDK